jgi:hypothetical protein
MEKEINLTFHDYCTFKNLDKEKDDLCVTFDNKSSFFFDIQT